MIDDDDGGSAPAAGPSSPQRDGNEATDGSDDDKLTDIRRWLAAVFARSVKAGERLLEDGRVAEAAVAFANATLLTDRAAAFAAAVRRVYPTYFYRLFERRMTAMGYGHLFVAADRTVAAADAAVGPPRRGSPDYAADGRSSDPDGRGPLPEESRSSTAR